MAVILGMESQMDITPFCAVQDVTNVHDQDWYRSYFGQLKPCHLGVQMS